MVALDIVWFVKVVMAFPIFNVSITNVLIHIKVFLCQTHSHGFATHIFNRVLLPDMASFWNKKSQSFKFRPNNVLRIPKKSINILSSKVDEAT